MPVLRLLPPVFQIPLCFLLCCSILSADTVEDVEETNENLKEVVKLREQLAAEKRAWREQKGLMEAQIRLDETALSNLEAVLKELQPELDSLGVESTKLAADWAEELVLERAPWSEEELVAQWEVDLAGASVAALDLELGVE